MGDKSIQKRNSTNPFTRKAFGKNNFFQKNGTGYHESRITKYLAFYFNPAEKHGFKTLFLSSFFESLGVADRCAITTPPLREVTCDKKARIDLIVEGDKWVYCIENKIRHHGNNPYNQYEKFTHATFPNKGCRFVLLTCQNQENSPVFTGWNLPDSWQILKYDIFLDAIRRNLPRFSTPDNEHLTLLTDFLTNLECEVFRPTLECYAEAFDTIEVALDDLHDNDRIAGIVGSDSDYDFLMESQFEGSPDRRWGLDRMCPKPPYGTLYLQRIDGFRLDFLVQIIYGVGFDLYHFRSKLTFDDILALIRLQVFECAKKIHQIEFGVKRSITTLNQLIKETCDLTILEFGTK